MELKRRIDYRNVFIVIYFLVFISYLVIGLLPANATDYHISGHIIIPSIGLKSDVTEIETRDGKINTPDTIVGSYSTNKNKTLLIGHASTVFESLFETKVGDRVLYNEQIYTIVAKQVYPKSEIRMSRLLRSSNRNTLVVMTCAGQDLGGGDATHRLIVTAEAE